MYYMCTCVQRHCHLECNSFNYCNLPSVLPMDIFRNKHTAQSSKTNRSFICVIQKKSQEPINTKGSDNITKKAFYKKGKTSL